MKRKETKTIDNVVFFDCMEERYSFTLEFGKDKEGEYGILTCPCPRLITLDEFEVFHRVHKISGRMLDFIEREFFDKQTLHLPSPVKYLREIGIEDIVFKILPEEIYEQLLDGTYNPEKPAPKKSRKKTPKKEDKVATFYSPQETSFMENVLDEIFKDKD